jgi:hypothetical protein
MKFFGTLMEEIPNKKAPGRNLPSGSVAILPNQTVGKKF